MSATCRPTRVVLQCPYCEAWQIDHAWPLGGQGELDAELTAHLDECKANVGSPRCAECGAEVCHPPPRACCSCGHGLLLNDHFGKGSAAICPRAQLHGTGPINCQACDWTLEGDG